MSERNASDQVTKSMSMLTELQKRTSGSLESKRLRVKRRVPRLTRIEAAWLAAAVDADGFISLTNEVPRPGKWPVVCVGVCNTNIMFAEWAAKLMKMKSFVASRGPSHFGKKPVYVAAGKGHERVLAILKQIEPYLIIKKAKANTVIRFIENRAWGAWQDPESCRRFAETVRRSWQDPEVRKRRINGMYLQQPHGKCKNCGVHRRFTTKGCRNCLHRRWYRMWKRQSNYGIDLVL